MRRSFRVEIVGAISDGKTIAAGLGIRQHARLVKAYGGARWRKMKGIALVRLRDGSLEVAGVHWYQAHGIGRRELKVKRLIGQRT
jgi:hypothetical protein